MSTIEIRDMDTESQYFVGTCSHVDDISEHFHREEVDVSAGHRAEWLLKMYDKGLRVKVAFVDDQPVGFLHGMPIEISPWGPLGHDLYAIPCLFVTRGAQGQGAGRALMAAAEEEARHQGLKGLVTTAYYHDFWFMPATFFERCGFAVAEQRDNRAILWKPFDRSAAPPKFLEPRYQYQPLAGKVAVDLFWNMFCPTSAIEAQRVREIAAEFGESVILNEYPADDRNILLQYQIPRGIFINGEEIGWGYEAPEAGIREAISQALERSKQQCD